MGILIVLVAQREHLEMENKTNYPCNLMCNSKETLKGLINEVLVNEPVRNTKSTETTHTYVSLITTALDVLKDSKQGIN
tara:strand:+ start:298 stop:534 length:237 start_codon:yes stop_codon:yes gene_type:complete